MYPDIGIHWLSSDAVHSQWLTLKTMILIVQVRNILDLLRFTLSHFVKRENSLNSTAKIFVQKVRNVRWLEDSISAVSFVRSFVRSFVCSFVRSFVRSFNRSFVQSFVRSFASVVLLGCYDDSMCVKSILDEP